MRMAFLPCAAAPNWQRERPLIGNPEEQMSRGAFYKQLRTTGGRYERSAIPQHEHAQHVANTYMVREHVAALEALAVALGVWADIADSAEAYMRLGLQGRGHRT
jgi:hypothetical protein